MRAMRERQLRHLVTPGTINAKYSQGGLAELEYIVQGLQITHGAADPSLRVTNTAEAIARLAAAGVISAENGARLGDALLFLHQLINALRMVRGNTRDLTVPAHRERGIRLPGTASGLWGRSEPAGRDDQRAHDLGAAPGREIAGVATPAIEIAGCHDAKPAESRLRRMHRAKVHQHT